MELRGFEPLTPCMPLMRGWFTTPCTTSPTYATEQVKGAAEGCVVGGEVACGVVSGKFLARPGVVAYQDATTASFRLALGVQADAGWAVGGQRCNTSWAVNHLRWPWSWM